MISTAFTKMLGIRHPVVQAGMGGVSRAELAAAVSNAGGLGILGMIRMSPDIIREQIRKTRALTDLPFGVNLVPPVASASGFEAQLAVCIEERVPVLSLFWCDPAPFVERCHAAGMIVLHQVPSTDEARSAAAAGVDVVVAQGVEAGGHGRGQLGILTLLPSVVEAVSPLPVLAAGGIIDGRGLAAALALGAQGVWVGTRFLASAESEAPRTIKSDCSRRARRTRCAAKCRAWSGLSTPRTGSCETRSPKGARRRPGRLRVSGRGNGRSTCRRSRARLRPSTPRDGPNSWPTMPARVWDASATSFPRR